jgi:hypothetical protein
MDISCNPVEAAEYGAGTDQQGDDNDGEMRPDHDCPAFSAARRFRM